MFKFTRTGVFCVSMIILFILAQICINQYVIETEINKDIMNMQTLEEAPEKQNIQKATTWQIEIPKIAINAKICQGTTKDVLNQYIGHFENTSIQQGNIVLAAYNRGYNVLMVDLRGHGESEGDYIGMGWHDRLDVIDWANYLIEKNPNCKIILHGVSMGGATVMMTTGEDLPGNIKVAIEDCGYTSIWDEFKMQLKELYNLPTFPVLNAASTVCKIKAEYILEEGSAVEQVRKSKTPTLFIHGELDSFVPFEMLDKVYEAANCKKEKLVIKGAAHAESASVNPELYWKTVDRFIEKNI